MADNTKAALESAARQWLLARDVVARALRELCGCGLRQANEYAAAVLARLAREGLVLEEAE